MDLVLSILATLLLVVAVLGTLVVVLSVRFFTARPPSGADAMGLIVPIVAGGISWLAMLLALWACIGRWGSEVSADAAFVAVSVLSVGLIGLALVGGAGGLAWSERKSHGAAKGFWGAFVLPAGVMIALSVAAWSAPEALTAARWPRWLSVPLAPAAALGWVVALRAYGRHLAMRHRAWQKQWDEDRARAAEFDRRAKLPRVEQVREELAEWSTEAPFWSYAMRLKDETDDGARQLLYDRSAAVADVDGQIASCLASEYPSVRAGALAFIEMAPAAKDEWAAPLAGSMKLLAEQIEHTGAMYSQPYTVQFAPEVERSKRAARRYGEARFAAEMQALDLAVEKVAANPVSSERA